MSSPGYLVMVRMWVSWLKWRMVVLERQQPAMRKGMGIINTFSKVVGSKRISQTFFSFSLIELFRS